jgi:hypothetical protein
MILAFSRNWLFPPAWKLYELEKQSKPTRGAYLLRKK